MNALDTTRRAAILRALVEGNSIRATARLTGTAKATVLKLLVELGEFCSIYQDYVLRNLPTTRIEADEIWAFVGAKQRRARREGDGDIWTFTALDSNSKLMISWLVGVRTAENATDFMRDVADRLMRDAAGKLAHRVQLTTDGHPMYLPAVERAFRWGGVDYAQLIKSYGQVEDVEHQRRYSPPVCTGAVKQWIMGRPDKALVSTSYVERANLTIRMGQRRFTRLTNAFSKKAENHAHAISLYFMHYNFCRPHQTLTKAHERHYPTTPAMAAGVTDRVWKVEDVLALMDPERLLPN